MTENENRTIMINANADSVEIGSASKGGKIKVYGNFEQPEEFKAKILAAIKLKEFANANLEIIK